jgi:hypothetical protein
MLWMRIELKTSYILSKFFTTRSSLVALFILMFNIAFITKVCDANSPWIHDHAKLIDFMLNFYPFLCASLVVKFTNCKCLTTQQFLYKKSWILVYHHYLNFCHHQRKVNIIFSSFFYWKGWYSHSFQQFHQSINYFAE